MEGNFLSTYTKYLVKILRDNVTLPLVQRIFPADSLRKGANILEMVEFHECYLLIQLSLEKTDWFRKSVAHYHQCQSLQRHDSRCPLPENLAKSRGPWFPITVENGVQWKSESTSKATTSAGKRFEGNSQERIEWRNCHLSVNKSGSTQHSKFSIRKSVK